MPTQPTLALDSAECLSKTCEGTSACVALCPSDKLQRPTQYIRPLGPLQLDRRPRASGGGAAPLAALAATCPSLPQLRTARASAAPRLPVSCFQLPGLPCSCPPAAPQLRQGWAHGPAARTAGSLSALSSCLYSSVTAACAAAASAACAASFSSMPKRECSVGQPGEATVVVGAVGCMQPARHATTQLHAEKNALKAMSAAAHTHLQ